VLETAGALLRAHSGIFLGIAVLLAGGGAAVARSRQPRAGGDPRLRGWLRVVLVGALVQAVGVAWDSWRHIHGDESAVGHLLAYTGVLAALVATVVAAWLQTSRHATADRSR
jgi:hypothetical protein